MQVRLGDWDAEARHTEDEVTRESAVGRSISRESVYREGVFTGSWCSAVQDG